VREPCIPGRMGGGCVGSGRGEGALYTWQDGRWMCGKWER